jgi:hypothetical protein
LHLAHQQAIERCCLTARELISEAGTPLPPAAQRIFLACGNQGKEEIALKFREAGRILGFY